MAYSLLIIAAVIGSIVLLKAGLFVANANRFYKRMAGLLDSPLIEKANIFNRGKLTGKYKDRIVECRKLGDYLFSVYVPLDNFEIRMKTASDAPYQQKGFFNLVRPTPDTFGEGPWVVYILNDFGSRADRRLSEILDNLYIGAGKYELMAEKEKNLKCLNCGHNIEPGQSACPQCGWTWQQVK